MAFVKKYIGFILTLLIFACLMTGIASDWSSKPSKGAAYDPPIMQMYNRSGLISGKQIKVLCDTLTPSTSTSQAISIASAGFTKILSATCTAQRNTTTLGSMPIAEIQTCTTSTLTVNIFDPNMSLVTILGSGVLLGGAVGFDSSPSTITLNITVIGY